MAQRIKNMKDLDAAIAALEERREFEWLEVKATSEALADSLRPANLVRQVVAEFVANPDVRKMLKHGASLAAGFAAQRVSVGKKSNPIMRMLSRFLQMTVTAAVDRMLAKK